MSLSPIARSMAALAAALGVALVCRGDDPAPVKVDTGEINGAQYAIANPPGDWNHRLLLLAHGYRPDDAPLVADLHPERPSVKAALDGGWLVATSSYRRNGMIIGDAIADLDALKDYISKQYGVPERIILEGESLGGLVVTLMAERDETAYSGAIAFDPTMYAKEPNGLVGISLLPRMPLLFVATYREALQPMRYQTALVARPPPVVPPVLFLIKREGHDNINQPEHMEAFDAMNAWLDHGPDALPRPKEQEQYFDATVAPDPGPSTSVIHADTHSLDTRVAEVDAVYGNVLLEAQAKDFEDAGIPLMTFFTFVEGGKAYHTLYGRTYSDVKKGEWVAFADADGRTVLSRYLGDGAATARLRPGTSLTLTAVNPGVIPSR